MGEGTGSPWGVRRQCGATQTKMWNGAGTGVGGPVQTGGDDPDRYGRRRFTTWTTGTTRCHEERASMEHSCFGEGTAGFWFLNH
jgi:hypothetical protein